MAAGPLKTSTLDPRLLTTRGASEPGEYRTFSEGIDNDGDGRFNEDDVGGINVNRTYPFEWDPAQSGSGPYPLAIPESEAVVDFFTNHPNITGAYSIHGGGWATNWVVRPPANVPDEELPEFDVDVMLMIGERYGDITGGEQMLSFWGENICFVIVFLKTKLMSSGMDNHLYSWISTENLWRSTDYPCISMGSAWIPMHG